MSATNHPVGWSEATARKRLAALLDPGSFTEVLGPEAREMSPHLALFDLPTQFDDGIIIGQASLGGANIFVAAQEGRFMGGAVGEVHGAKLVGLLRAAKTAGRDVLLLLDTGGVRLQEANAGEMAIAEIVRAIVELRASGRAVIALIGGKSGCYGGGGIIAGCCSRIVVTEQGRIGVSGPEVIETNRGVEEFDSADRAFVWRTMGGKHRYLLGAADAFVADEASAFRAAAIAALGDSAALTLEVLAAEQARLETRLARFGTMRDGREVWQALGIDDPAELPGLGTQAFLNVIDGKRESADAAR